MATPVEWQHQWSGNDALASADRRPRLEAPARGGSRRSYMRVAVAGGGSGGWRQRRMVMATDNDAGVEGCISDLSMYLVNAVIAIWNFMNFPCFALFEIRLFWSTQA
ncbi:unnamed protein product [Cuscuta epithymum]|uniref:Uncharacterized protein n=1 Tax=Cuscuta epithymum TaxID=186058 RepID=A0AAV0F5S3_9ASTE|nr:unnamed protein product [Cuscuta epithymum]